MKRIILSILFAFSLVPCVAAQNPKVEPGRPEELRGVVRVFVQSDEERARQNIIREIEEKLPQLTFVEKAEDAQIILTFHQIRRHYRSHTPSPIGSVERRGTARQIEPRGPTTFPSVEFQISALGAVIKPVGTTTSRRLLRFEDTVSSSLEDKLSLGFARAFIKLYNKANHK